MEMAALRTLDTIGFIIRGLDAPYTTNSSFSALLHKLGVIHNNMGVKVGDYRIMLEQMDETLKCFFPQTYSLQVQFALSEIIIFTAHSMSGKDPKIPHPPNDVSFLYSLRACIKHNIGREYLFRYLHQAYCDEMVVFLHFLCLYKAAINTQTRYKIAQIIATLCLDIESPFGINICFEHRQKVIKYKNI